MKAIIITALWFLIGAGLLNLAVIIFSHTGLLYSKYDREGRIKKKIPLSGLLSSLSALLVITILFILYDYSLFKGADQTEYLSILTANFILLFILDIYDALFIDIFVIGIWRPGFLKLKDYYSLDSMKTHIIKQFTVAWIIKIPLILIGSFFSYMIN